MSTTHASAGYEPLMERITAWARGRDDVRAMALIGSRARRAHPADIWSDIDLIVLTAGPADTYAAGIAWLAPVEN